MKSILITAIAILLSVMLLSDCSHSKFINTSFLVTDSNTGINFLDVAPTDPSGTISGSVAVDPSGGATYEIVISAAPGTNGVQPDLKLMYHSLQGNGITGVGWSLTGLSKISRTGKTFAQDGSKTGVTLTSGDRFTLDGQRLIAYKDADGNVLSSRSLRDAAYGKNGTEYRTEIETWVRVYSQGECGTGPCSFKVVSKNGSISLYGTGNSAQVIATDGTIREWSVGSVTDKNGNYVNVDYSSDGNWLYPQSIYYTGNTAAGLPAQRAISFNYEPRNDVVTGYMAGYAITVNKRLKTIATYLDQDGDGNGVIDTENLIRSYTMTYINSLSSSSSLISEMVECDAKGNCLSPNTYEYGRNKSLDAPFTTGSYNAVSAIDVQSAAILSGDYNGDGITDFMRQELVNTSRSVNVYLSNGSGQFNSKSYTASLNLDVSSALLLLGDFNADNKTDFLRQEKINNSNSVVLYISNGDGTFSPTTYTAAQELDYSSANLIPADYNGDGVVDFLRQDKINYTQSFNIYFNNGSASFTNQNFTATDDIDYASAVVIPGDYTGNGKNSFIAQQKLNPSNNVTIYSLDGNNSLQSINVSGSTANPLSIDDCNILSGDYNGDGITDFIRQESINTSSQAILYMGNGGSNGFTNKTISFNKNVDSSSAYLIGGDFNGDGITDLLRQPSGGSSTQYQIYYFGADAEIVEKDYTAISEINTSEASLILGDFNGDGTSDFASVEVVNTSSILNQYYSLVSASDFITAIKNGLSEVNQFTYQTMTSDQVYTIGTGAQYPYQNIQAPRWLLKNHKKYFVQDSDTTQFNYQFHYTDAQVNLNRGWLGYSTITATDPQNKTTTTSNYNNRFPLSGLVSSKVMADSENAALLMGVTSDRYNTVPVLTDAIYSVTKSNSTIRHYTLGVYNYTLLKNFHYNSLGSKLVQIDNLGDSSIASDDFYTGINYAPDTGVDSTWWQSFFPVDQKVSKTASSSGNFTSWNSTYDLKWQKFSYGSEMNLDTASIYLDTNGGENQLSDIWINKVNEYDQVGNVISETGSDSVVWKKKYDLVYQTFPITLISPKTSGGTDSLVSSIMYDPRFGVITSETDPNGVITHSIPNNGINGLGIQLIWQATSPNSNTLTTIYQSDFSASSDGVGMTIGTYIRPSWSENDTARWLYKKEFFDPLNRKTMVQSRGYDSETSVITKFSFNDQGSIKNEYLTYFYNASKKYHYSENGASFSTPVYFQHYYDQHGRPDSLLSPNPVDVQTHFLSRDMEFELHDNRKVIYTTPHPDHNDSLVNWVQFLDARGRTTQKSGPYKVDMSAYPETATTHYTYDPLGRLKTITDPLGLVTELAYNSLGEVISKINDESGTTTIGYDYYGSVIYKKNSNNEVINITYDALKRKREKTLTAPDQSIQSTTRYLYDLSSTNNGKGRLCKVIMDDAVYEYQYDNVGNVSEKSTSISGLYLNNPADSVFVFQYQYDPQGRMTEVTYPDQSVVNYNFDRPDYLLSSVSESNDTIAAFSDYYTTGTFGNILYDNGLESNYHYDFLGRMDSLRTSRNAFDYDYLSYSWNHSNKLKNIEDMNTLNSVKLNESFKFDPTGKLITATGPYLNEHDSLEEITYSYNYDLNANRTAFHSKQGADPIENYSISHGTQKKNQISSIDFNGGNSISYAYDPVGNIDTITTSAGSEEIYLFNAEGSLLSVDDSNGNNLISFKYDQSGMRIKKQSGDTITYYIGQLYEVVTIDTVQVATRYVYGPLGALQAKSVDASSITLLESGSGDTSILNIMDDPAILPLFVKYIFLGSLLLMLLWVLTKVFQRNYQHKRLWVNRKIYRPIALGFGLWAYLMVMLFPNPAMATVKGKGVPTTGKTLYFSYNQVGSNILTTDQSGGKASKIVYKPFGGIAQQDGDDNFRPKFTGKELDEKIQNYYMGSRYYNAAFGHFISPDPANQYNSPYVYGYDDPLSGQDPNGEFFVTLAILITAAVVGAYIGGAIANKSFNPLKWNWTSGRTWLGIVGGAAIGVAVAAGAMAGLAALGVVGAASVSVGGVTASTIALTAADVAFLAYDSYQFSQDMTVENGIFVALDLIPFAGALIGRAAHGIRALAKGADVAAHESEVALRSERAVAEAPGEAVHNACPLSFTGETEIQTADGLAKIKNLEVGDLVASVNPETGVRKMLPVSKVFTRLAASILLIVTVNDTIEATENHPFYTENHGWVEAGDLQEDYKIKTYGDNPCGSSAIVGISTLTGDYQVYNFEVPVNHTYLVGSEGYLAHNPKGCGLTDLGGAHGQTKKNSEQFLVESNHFPASSSYNGTVYDAIPYNSRPAVTMDYDLHRVANSTGSSHSAVAWRAQQTALLKQGKFAEAMAMDIKNMKSLSSTYYKDARYYSSGMQEAVEYTSNYTINGVPVISKSEKTNLINLIWK